MSLDFFALNYAVYTGVTQPGSLPWGSVMAWLAGWMWVPSWWSIMIFILLLFPSGKLPSRRWRPVAYFVVIVIATNLVVRMFMPGPLDWSVPTFENPVGIGGAFGHALQMAGRVFPLLLVSVLASAFSLIVRFIGATSIERQQIKWLAYAGSMVALLVVLFSGLFYGNEILWNPWVETILFQAFLGIPISVGIAILKHQLYDIDLIINRTLVYGTLTASVFGLYVLTIGGLSIVLQTQNILPGIVIALLAIAFLFQPLRQRLQGVADRFVPVPMAIISQSIPPPMQQTKQEQEVSVIDSAPSTILRGRWLALARLAWVIGFMVLTIMYALGFLAVHDALSTVCEEERCTLRQQIRHTDAGDKVLGWPGPSVGFADPLRSHQVKALETLGLTLDQYGQLGALQMGIPSLVLLLIAAGLFWQKSDDWMVLFGSVMVATFPLHNTPLPFTLAVRQPAWEWTFDSAGTVALSCLLIFPLVFPNGRFVPRWTRWMAVYVVAGAVMETLFRNTIREVTGVRAFFGIVYLLPSFGVVVYAQLYRYFRVARPAERQQFKWVAAGLVGFVVTQFVLIALNALLTSPTVSADPARALILSAIPDTLWQVNNLVIAVSITFSVLRYRLWDIDILINRSLVYGALIVSVIGLYMIVVGVAGALFQSVGNTLLTILATGLIAVLFHPLRQRLQRGINHLMYGERDDPYAALSRLGRRLEASLAPEAVLPTVVTTVREVLKLPYVAIYLGQDPDGYKIIAESASPSLRIEGGRIRVPGMSREGLCIPLIHQGETLGYIVLGPRAPNEAFSSTDLHLLDDIAPQVGVAVHSVRLTADLQRSREQLVLAREEERRRLRRDLHDDLAPTLASLGLTASTAADLIPTNPTTATKLIKELQSEIRATVGNIRRLVYDLRPPTLDELGLLAAVRERAAQYSNAPGGVHITVDAPAELPALPAAVEVAAYRIVQEALENVSKHSQARQCAIRFANHNGLELEITDDGIGLPPNITPGVGLRSMRERSEELGGICMIERRVNGGTRILARLPIGGFDGSLAHPDRG